MKNIKLFFLLTLFIFLSINIVAAQTAKSEYKVLIQGNQSSVEKPFIFVARDADTYAQLQNLVQNLPAAQTIDFERSAVVAAFAGTKPTGGYGVKINKVSGTNMIDITAPPKGAMVTQMITQPFKVVLIPINDDGALPLDSTATWANAMQNYRVTSGNFEFAGGFAGKQTKFTANGSIAVWTYGDYVTIFFNLRETGKQRNRRLMEYASGTLKNGKIELAAVNPGSFVANPRPLSGASGTLQGKNLFLNFKSLPTKFGDGFTGSGRIGAVKVR